jgi:hypothetical protein
VRQAAARNIQRRVTKTLRLSIPRGCTEQLRASRPSLDALFA